MFRTVARALLLALLGTVALAATAGTASASTGACTGTDTTATAICRAAHATAANLAAPGVPATGNGKPTVTTATDANGLTTLTATASRIVRTHGRGRPYTVRTVTAVVTYLATGDHAFLGAQATVLDVPCKQTRSRRSLARDCGTGTLTVTTRLPGTVTTLLGDTFTVDQPTSYATYRSTLTRRGNLLGTATITWAYDSQANAATWIAPTFGQ